MATRKGVQGTVNVERRTWDKAKFKELAKERAEKLAAAGDNEEEIAKVLGLNTDEDAAVEELQRKAIEKLSARPEEAGPMGSERAFAKQRNYKLNLEDRIGKRRVVSGAGSNQAGFYCAVTDTTLRDHQGYLNHINGKKYNRALGYSLRVERSSKEDVQGKLAALKRRKAEEDGVVAAVQAAAGDRAGGMTRAEVLRQYELSKAEREAKERVQAAEAAESQRVEEAKARRRAKRRRKAEERAQSEGKVAGGLLAGADPALLAMLGASAAASSSSSSSSSNSDGDDDGESEDEELAEEERGEEAKEAGEQAAGESNAAMDAEGDDEDAIDPVLCAIMGVPGYEDVNVP